MKYHPFYSAWRRLLSVRESHFVFIQFDSPMTYFDTLVHEQEGTGTVSRTLSTSTALACCIISSDGLTRGRGGGGGFTCTGDVKATGAFHGHGGGRGEKSAFISIFPLDVHFEVAPRHDRYVTLGKHRQPLSPTYWTVSPIARDRECRSTNFRSASGGVHEPWCICVKSYTGSAKQD